MPINTKIQWCDSTINIQMGCEGCELIKGQETPKCYAKTLTDRWAGTNSGWPDAFEKPKIFMERIPKMLQWQDMTGKLRLTKPWLNGMPRLIFLNDMGDTFSNGMPHDWFADVLPQIKDSPHQHLVLTKWPQRFANFSNRHTLPSNVWPGTTITSQKTIFRAHMLSYIKNNSIKWLSIEPLWGHVDISAIIRNIDWVIVGGESGIKPTPCNIDDIKFIIQQCRDAGVPVFVKQLGTYLSKQLNLSDAHGGNWDEWPDELRVRQMPALKH